MKPKKEISGRMVSKGKEKKNKIETSRKKQLAPKKSIPAPKDDDDDDTIDSYGNIRDLIDYDYDSEDDDSEEDDEEEEDEDSEEEDEEDIQPKRPIRKAAIKANKIIKKQLQKEESDSEDEDDDDYMEVDDENQESKEKMPGISISFGSFGSNDTERLVPKRHNMKKESEDVKKFVKLLTKPAEHSTIDDQIDQFKTLEVNKQKQMIEALERNALPSNAEQSLMFKILTMNLNPEIQTMVLSKYNNLQNMEPSTSEYYKLRSWLEKLVSLPIGIYKQLPAKIEDGQEICGNFMRRAQKCLADAIYGQEEAKLQILQFIATKMANPDSRGLSLMLVGAPGIGKTSLIKNGIAKALDWPFQFISLGGDSDATTYTGHQLVYEGSHCGKIVNSLATAKSMSMVLLFDELDKISQTPKGEEVQNLLIHLTDSVQNSDFEDKYLAGIPIDLSKVMFVFSGNDLNKIDRILLDRMIVIKLEGYKVPEKIAIAEKFLIPNALKEVHLDEKISFTKEIVQHILETYAKEETGVREFKRMIEQVVQKLNMLRIFNSKDMPFYIPNFTLPFVLKKEHIDLFLKKKSVEEDISFMRMYS